MKDECVQGEDKAEHKAAIPPPILPATTNPNAEKNVGKNNVCKDDHGSVSVKEMSTIRHHAGWCDARWQSFEDVLEVLQFSTLQPDVTFGLITFHCLHDMDFNLVAFLQQLIVQTVRLF